MIFLLASFLPNRFDLLTHVFKCQREGHLRDVHSARSQINFYSDCASSRRRCRTLLWTELVMIAASIKYSHLGLSLRVANFSTVSEGWGQQVRQWGCRDQRTLMQVVDWMTRSQKWGNMESSIDNILFYRVVRILLYQDRNKWLYHWLNVWYSPWRYCRRSHKSHCCWHWYLKHPGTSAS